MEWLNNSSNTCADASCVIRNHNICQAWITNSRNKQSVSINSQLMQIEASPQLPIYVPIALCSIISYTILIFLCNLGSRFCSSYWKLTQPSRYIGSSVKESEKSEHHNWLLHIHLLVHHIIEATIRYDSFSCIVCKVLHNHY